MPDYTLLPLKTDLSIYKKFNFERSPVSINYCFYKPKGFKKLDKPVGLCEMVKACQEKGEPFYITGDEEDCVGKRFLGLPTSDKGANVTPHYPDGGRLGVNLGAFQRPAANLRLRTFCSLMVPGSIHYVLYTPMDKIKYEPDLLVFVCPPTQAEVILRASTYTTGEMFESRGTTVANCTSLYIYPYQTGKINYMVTGLSWGMNGRRVYPEGLIILVVPFQQLRMVTDNLKEMTWYRDSLKLDRDGYVKWDYELTKKTQEDSKDF
jgi:uncharacterized protein (DUF169 family)